MKKGLAEASGMFTSLGIYTSNNHERIVVICFGLSQDNVRRQPWHVAFGLAQGAASLGHQCTLITDSPTPPGGGKVSVECVDGLIKHGRLHAALEQRLDEIAPHRVLIITGPSELVRMRALPLRFNISLILASARLEPSRIAGLGLRTWMREWRLLARPMINALIPGWMLRRGFRQSRAKQIFCLSPSAACSFAKSGLPVKGVILPQILHRKWPSPKDSKRKTIAYFGPALELRGAFSALEAYERACDLGLDAELHMIIRPDPGTDRSQELLNLARKSRFASRIQIERRHLDAQQLMQRLEAAHIFLLPFSVTVSDVPLVVIEAGLSGRKLIVMDAPGVGEIARSLGAHVASSKNNLPRALIEAAADRRVVRPDPTSWCDWQHQAERLIETSPASDPRQELHDRQRAMATMQQHGQCGLHLVALSGVDGAGKTAILKRLQQRLSMVDVPNRHVWSRFRNYTSKPLLAFARVTGHNRKDRSQGVEVGYHDFSGTPLLAASFVALQVIDNLIDIAIRFRRQLGPDHRPQLIVADRCVVDTLVDLVIDTGREEWLFGSLGRFLINRLPQPRAIVVLHRDASSIASDRPDVLVDRNFMKRRTLYLKLAQTFSFPVINNDQTIDDAVDEIMELVHENTEKLAPLGSQQNRPELTEIGA